MTHRPSFKGRLDFDGVKIRVVYGGLTDHSREKPKYYRIKKQAYSKYMAVGAALWQRLYLLFVRPTQCQCQV